MLNKQFKIYYIYTYITKHIFTNKTLFIHLFLSNCICLTEPILLIRTTSHFHYVAYIIKFANYHSNTLLFGIFLNILYLTKSVCLKDES